MALDETFTCPRCGRTSANPNDVREGYCGACHDWTGRRPTVVIARLEDEKPTTLPVIMVECDVCHKAGWLNGDDPSLIERYNMVCQPCMAVILEAQQAEPMGERVGNIDKPGKPIDANYVNQATTAAATMLAAYRNRASN